MANDTPRMGSDSRSSAEAALSRYREARAYASSDAEDIADLIADLAHLADKSEDPDLTGLNVILEADVVEDSAGESVMSTAFNNYRAENHPPRA